MNIKDLVIIICIFLQNVFSINVYAQSDGNKEQKPISEEIVNVDLYTGDLNLSIPLYNFHVRSLDCPIVLNYSPVDLISKLRNTTTPYINKACHAGHVGLGWSINSGGYISRRIKGIPDESIENEETHLGKGNFQNFLSNFDPAKNREYDPEEDVFSFNFFGYSGTFIFYRGSWKIFSDNEFRIVPQFSSKNELLGFILETQDGITYTFGGDYRDRQENSVTWEASIGEETNLQHRVGWHLTNIETTDGERIDFHYLTTNIYYPYTTQFKTTQITHTELFKQKEDGTFEANLYWAYSNVNEYPKDEDIANMSKGLMITQAVLGQISCQTSRLSVEFNYINTNEPFSIGFYKRNPIKIENISVLYNDIAFKKFVFDYRDTPSEALNLTSVREYAVSGNISLGSIPPYTFLYSEKNDNKAPESLVQITYPTGGSTTFEYEYDYTFKDLRIKKQISKGSELDNELATYYYYVSNFPDLSPGGINDVATSAQNSVKNVKGPTLINGQVINGIISPGNYKYTLYLGDSYKHTITSEMGDFVYTDDLRNPTVSGNNVGYSSVWTVQGTNNLSTNDRIMGYKHYNFLNFMESEYLGFDAQGEEMYKTTYHNMNDVGKIIKYEEFDVQKRMIKQIDYKYDMINEVEYLNRHTLHSVEYYDNINKKFTHSTPYSYLTKYYKYKLVKETEISCLGDLKETTYTYDPNNYLLRAKCVTGWDINNESIRNNLPEEEVVLTKYKTVYKYLVDFINPTANNQYREWHRVLNMPIETVFMKDDKIIGAELVTVTSKNIPYSSFGYLNYQFVVPSEIFTLDISDPISDYATASSDWSNKDSRLKLKRAYKFDDYGNMIEKSDSKGNKITYIGHTEENNYLPVIILKNIGHAEYDNSSVSGLSYSIDDVNKRRAALPNALITNFTYNPKFGTVASETGPNGLTMSYEYDDFGRLKTVKDHNFNIIKKYEYIYKAQ